MNIGSNISKVFRLNRTDLTDDEAFNSAMNSAIEAAAERVGADSANSVQAIQPITKLLEKCKELRRDCLIVLGKALIAIGPNQHLKKELRDYLMQSSHISKEALPDLAHYAQQDLFNITLWRRLIDDFEFYKKYKSAARMKMAYVVNVAPHFPDQKESSWYDMETEAEAHKYLEIVYNELLEDFNPEWTRVDVSLEFADVLAKFRPYDDRAAFAIALIFAAQKNVERSKFPLVEMAYEISPEVHLLKRYVGLGWAQFQVEDKTRDAFNVLQEVFATDPDDKVVEDALVVLAAKLDLKPEEKLAFLKGLSDSHPTNRQFKLDYVKTLARHNPHHSTVLRLITEVMAYAPQDNELQYLQANVMIQQQNPVQAVGILERIYQRDPENPQIIKALSECYASIGRRDSRALKIYSQAIDHGSTDEQTAHFHLVELFQQGASKEEIQKALSSMGNFEKNSILNQIANIQLNSKTKIQDYIQLMPKAAEDERELLSLLAGKALADEPNRSNVRMIISQPPTVSINILEHAYSTAPESNLLAMQLVKSRLLAKNHDQRTLDLLAQICRAEPDEIELRVKRAELLDAKGEKKAALAIYQELYNRQTFSSRSSSATAVHLDWEQLREQILEKIFQLTLSLENPAQEDLDVVFKHLQSPRASIELIIDMARRPLGKYTHPCQQVIMEKAKIVSPDDEIIQRNLAIVRLTNCNTALFEEYWQNAAAEEKAMVVDQLTKRLNSLKKKNPAFKLKENVGQVLANCLESFDHYKREQFQTLISDHCD
ncbi:MAG: tetratricopeptide repeat protein [Sumerlaeia bacterium]